MRYKKCQCCRYRTSHHVVTVFLSTITHTPTQRSIRSLTTWRRASVIIIRVKVSRRAFCKIKHFSNCHIYYGISIYKIRLTIYIAINKIESKKKMLIIQYNSILALCTHVHVAYLYNHGLFSKCSIHGKWKWVDTTQKISEISNSWISDYSEYFILCDSEDYKYAAILILNFRSTILERIYGMN